MKKLIRKILVLSLIISTNSFSDAITLPQSVYHSPNNVKGHSDLTVTYKSIQGLPINCSCFPNGICPPKCGVTKDAHVYITLSERPYHAVIKYGDEFKCYGNKDNDFKMDFKALPVYSSNKKKLSHELGKGSMLARHNYIHWYSSYPMKNKSLIINHSQDWEYSCPKSIKGKIIQNVIGNCSDDKREKQDIKWYEDEIRDIFIFETQSKGAQAWGNNFNTYAEGALHPYAHERPHLYQETLEDYRFDGGEPQLINVRKSLCGSDPWPIMSFQPYFATQPASLK